MDTQVTLIDPTAERQHRWPGHIATATIYACSDENAQIPEWRFGELSITSSGAMPQLAGHSRHIALLEGEGLLVMHDADERTELLERGASGHMKLEGNNEVELIEGPVRLLDIVVDAGQYTTSAFVLGDEENMQGIDADLLILFGLDGERMHCILDELEFNLSAEQWIRVDRPPKSDLQCTDGRVLVLAAKAI
ncbi:MAG: HutD family protein [Granulosicoccaceae bacterium]